MSEDFETDEKRKEDSLPPGVSVEAGITPRLQVGEPWWWVTGDHKICLYDDAARAALGGKFAFTNPSSSTARSSSENAPNNEGT